MGSHSGLLSGWCNESIRTLYAQVTSSFDNNYDTQALRISDRFSRLRSLAKEECQTQFRINVDSSLSNDWQWHFNLQIGDQVIFQSEILNKGLDDDFDEVCTLGECISCANEYINNKSILSLENYIQTRILTMSDDESVQEHLRQNIENNLFSSAGFKGIVPHQNSSKFIANFEGGSLVLSNRSTEHNEYRGGLKNLLEKSDFTNLRSLLSEGHGTDKDNLLLYMATPSKGDLARILGDDDKFSSENIRTIAYSQKVANTTVGALWKLEKPDNVNISMTGLTTDKPSAVFLLKYLDGIIKDTDIAWSVSNSQQSEIQCDQKAHRIFNCDALIIDLLNTDKEHKKQILKNMEGEFGLRLRGVVESAAGKVGEKENDPVLVSTAYKYTTLMEDLVVTLRNQLGKKEIEVGQCEDIRQYSELTVSEIEALSMVGIKQTMLE